MNARELIAELKGVKKCGVGWTAKCPAHDDTRNSLSVSEGDDGRLLLKCHAGCEFESILAAVPHTNSNSNSNNGRHEVATYDYRNERGDLLYQSVRFGPIKDFRQRRPDGSGGWVWNLNGHARVLYRLPEILAAKPSQTILVVEGEKDADRLASIGLVATTNPCGAGKWRSEEEFNKPLRDRRVAIIQDNDDPGRAHAEDVATKLQGIAASIKIIGLPNLPDKGDVTEWLDAGGTLSQLRELVKDAPEFAGPTPTDSGKPKGRTSTTQFNFATLDDLLAEPQEEIDCVVDQMLPCGGFSNVCAKPKVGKSTLARNLAVCVATGKPFFGRPVKQGKVIYLCLEEKRAEVADHFRRMGASGANIIIHTGATPKDVLTALETAIEEYSPALVIIDPLSRFIRVTDFSSYGDVTLALEPLIDLARNSKCQTHIMALHHNGKSADLRESGDAVLGSTAFFGIVDTLVTMRKRERARTIETVQRYGEDLPETIVHLDAETRIVSAAGDMKDFTLNERKRLVLESMRSEPLSEAGIKEAVGGTNKGLTSRAVRELFDEKKLTRSGAGKKGDPFLYGEPSNCNTSTVNTDTFMGSEDLPISNQSLRISDDLEEENNQGGTGGD
jgi:putative DNA primase/helicase